MALKKILLTELERWYKAMVIISTPVPVSSNETYGHQIDKAVSDFLSTITANAKGYKIEDDGALVGVYVVDYDSGGMQYLKSQILRPVFTNSEITAINTQVNNWVQGDHLLS